jgi:DNA-binding NtrC family response regulator
MLEGRHIALIEDDEIMGGSLEQRLKLEGARVVWFKTFHRALGGLRTPHRAFDAVVCDIRLSDGSGEELFYRLGETGTPPPFLFVTGQGETDQAVRLLRSGAADYLTKPFEMAQFLERLALLVAPSFDSAEGPLLGPSKQAQEIETQLARFATLDAPVMIMGESGTGKAAAALRLHALSDRSAAPFKALDLSRIAPEDHAARLLGPDGGFGEACQGVLLIERIGEATPETQAALLQACWTAGAEGPRLIVTEGPGNVAERKLRPDAFFHFGTLSLTIPPLRDRPEDALWMAARMFEGMNARRAQPLAGIAAQAEERILRHNWPGNGRELRARLARAMALAGGERIMPADLFPDVLPSDAQDEGFASLAEMRDQAERRHIQRALERSAGSTAEAAKLLQIARTTLWEKMQKLGLQRPVEPVRKSEQRGQ